MSSVLIDNSVDVDWNVTVSSAERLLSLPPIVSGIAKQFKPEELVGKQVCFVANLAPRTMRGIVSQGMILSAEDNEGKLSLLTVAPTAKPGSEVK